MKSQHEAVNTDHETLARPAYGLAWIDGALRPFMEWREIRRGQRKGWFEVLLCGARKKVVAPDKIRRFPVAAEG